MRAWLCFVACLTLVGALACDDTKQGGDPPQDLGMDAQLQDANPDSPDVEPDAMPDPVEDAPTDIDEVRDVGEPDVIEDVVDEPEVGEVCEPNAVVRCLVENGTTIERCNDAGDGLVVTSCPGLSLCRTQEGVPACVEVACVPGTRICLDDDTPAVCDNEAQGFEAGEPCERGSLCQGGACIDACELAALSSSYLGCEYWPVELPSAALHAPDLGSNAPFAVVLANPNESPTFVTVRDPEGQIQTSIPSVQVEDEFNFGLGEEIVVTTHTQGVGEAPSEPIEGPLLEIEIPPGGTAQILMPRVTHDNEHSTIQAIAWHVQTDLPVAAYQFSPICCNYTFSNDATLLIPRGALSASYMAMSQPHWLPMFGDESFPPTLSVAAIEDETEVVVTLGDVAIQAGEDPRLAGQPDEEGVLRVVLDAQEVLNLQTAEVNSDLTGVRVQADKPVTAYAGHNCTNLPEDQAACDHLEHQLYPTESWGRGFVATPLSLRNPLADTDETTYWRLLALHDDTIVTFDRDFDLLEATEPAFAVTPDCVDLIQDDNTLTLGAGAYCEFGSRISFALSSSAPMQVGGFMSGQDSTRLGFEQSAGDPAFFLVPPQEQYRASYDFLTPPTIALDFLTLVAPENANIVLDGEALDLGIFNTEAIVSQGFVRVHIPVADGPHRVESDSPFGILVYGYDDYVSYAYTGGLNLTKFR